jgi:hypothetical protein
LDVVIALTAAHPDPDVIDLTAAITGETRTTIAQLLTGTTGHIVVASREHPRRPQLAHIAARHTEHFRHEHKYDTGGTPAQRGFWFRDDHDRPTGRVARSLHDLEQELARCDTGVIRHHGPLEDFSRWIAAVFHDRDLAAAVAAIEQRIRTTSSDTFTNAARVELVQTIHRRQHAHSVETTDMR